MGLLKAINDLSRHNAPFSEQMKTAFHNFYEKGWYVLGSEVAEFEKEFASYCGAKHAIGVANGTDALEIALRAAGVGSGKKVALVANAGTYGTFAINLLNATPVYVDVDADTSNMSPEALSAVLDANDVQAIIVTHLYGRLADIEAIKQQAEKRNIKLIEDCAQAHGASIDGKKAGTWGDISTFSFYPTKNLGALGDGGALATNDDALAAAIKQYRQYGWSQKYSATVQYGRNSRLDEIQAAFLRVKLPHLDSWNARRNAIAKLYQSTIKHPHVTLPPVGEKDFVAHLFVIRCEQRDSLVAHLRSKSVPHDIHFPVPDHLQPMFDGRFSASAVPVTERLCKEVLTLPCFPEMTDEEVNWVAAAVNDWRT